MQIDQSCLKSIYTPSKSSHKGQNGRLLIIGGSNLFHAASLWALKVASRIVDLVHYSSVEENNLIVHELKKEFRNGIVVPRSDIEGYIEEDDVILIGPGMVRQEMPNAKCQMSNKKLEDILKIENEGEMTGALTNYLLQKFPQKQWVIDAGALQMIDPEVIPKGAILTPHKSEFTGLLNRDICNKDASGQNFLTSSHAEVANKNLDASSDSLANKGNPYHNVKSRSQGEAAQNFVSSPHATAYQKVKYFAEKHKCIVLLKGEKDFACNGLSGECKEIMGGNAGMTKGGTGDVLAGLVAALACKNNPWLATLAGSFINKKAGDELFKKVGYFFNASDLADEIPKTMKRLLI